MASATLRTLPRVASRVPAPVRRWLLIALATSIVLLAGYWGWFRHSSFARVENVSVFGLSTSDAPRIRAALESAAREQSTLDPDVKELQKAVSAYPIVRSITVTADFPHGLQIDVQEHRPVAVILAASQRIAANSDGTLLPGVTASGGLPVIRLKGAMPAKRLADPQALELARTLGAAPEEMRRRLLDARVRRKDGIVVRVRQGPEVIFGDSTELGAKWAAAVRVLADPKAAGASYIDVRLPERPAAGGLGVETIAPVAPAGPPAVAPPAPGSGNGGVSGIGQGTTGATGPSPPPAAVTPPPAAPTGGQAAPTTP
jgi:cell division protein FtsQ